MLRSYIFKLLHSPFLYVSILGIVGLCIARISDLRYSPDVYDGIRNLVDGAGGYRSAFVVFAAIPFASNFADEWNTKTITNCVTRKNAFNYAVSNAVTCFISALITVFISFMIFTAIWTVISGKPYLYTINHQNSSNTLIRMGMPFLSTVTYSLTYSVSCAMWTVAGMTLSAFFPSKYIAIGAPFILNYAIGQLTQERLPDMLDLMILSTWGSYLKYFFYSVFVFVVLSVICGFIFVHKVERRVQNELG